jgi:hypothetical protein
MQVHVLGAITVGLLVAPTVATANTNVFNGRIAFSSFRVDRVS